MFMLFSSIFRTNIVSQVYQVYGSLKFPEKEKKSANKYKEKGEEEKKKIRGEKRKNNTQKKYRSLLH